MLTHVMAASVPGNMYIMDSGAEEHVSREVDIFTDVNTGASVPLQIADGTEMKAHVLGTVRELQRAVGVRDLSLPGLILNARVLDDMDTEGVHSAIIYTRAEVLIMQSRNLSIRRQIARLGLHTVSSGPRRGNLYYMMLESIPSVSRRS